MSRLEHLLLTVAIAMTLCSTTAQAQSMRPVMRSGADPGVDASSETLPPPPPSLDDGAPRDEPVDPAAAGLRELRLRRAR